MKYARFQVNKVKKYGIIRDDLLFELKDSYFLTSEKSGRKYNINSVYIINIFKRKLVLLDIHDLFMLF